MLKVYAAHFLKGVLRVMMIDPPVIIATWANQNWALGMYKDAHVVLDRLELTVGGILDVLESVAT